MKKLIPFILLFLAANMQAQDYRCISDTDYLYINPDKYFEGVHIKTNLGDSLSFFHPVIEYLYGEWATDQFKYISPWIGEKVIIRENETVFFCDSIDSLVIKTKADSGFQWSFYKNLINAKVVKVDTMTLFNNIIDSVKVIKLINNNPPFHDFITGKQIILSKNHGLVSFCKVVGFDGISFVSYKKTNRKIPTYYDIYQYEVGDVFQWKKGYSNYYKDVSTYITDTIIDVTKTKDSLIYQIKSSEFWCVINNPNISYCPSCKRPHDTCSHKKQSVKTKSYGINKNFNAYPNENKFSDFFQPVSYSMFLDEQDHLVVKDYYCDGFYVYDYELIEGIGIKDSSAGNTEGMPIERGNFYHYRLVAYKKINGDQLGKFASKVEDTFEKNISLYPNPAHENFTIELPMEYEACRIELISADGSVVLSTRFINSGQNVISTDNLAPGFYVVRIGARRDVFYKKIVLY